MGQSSLAHQSTHVPEACESKQAGPEADLWAFGCVIYQLLVGVNYFRSESQYFTFMLVKNFREFLPELWLSSAANGVIHALLRHEPSKRLGADGQYSALASHAFFDGFDAPAAASQRIVGAIDIVVNVVDSNGEEKMKNKNEEEEEEEEEDDDDDEELCLLPPPSKLEQEVESLAIGDRQADALYDQTSRVIASVAHARMPETPLSSSIQTIRRF